MKVLQYQQQGRYDYLKMEELASEKADDGKALVRIIAASVSPTDSKMLLGKLPFPIKLPHIPGNGAVGVIEETGDSALPRGTKVILKNFYFAEGGTWREYMRLPADKLWPLPSHLSEFQGAGLIESYLTAYVALVYVGKFQTGQSLLIPAVGGGVGNAAIQLAKALGAKTIISTAGSPAKASAAREAAYMNVIDLSQENLPEAIHKITANKGVELVIDSVGMTEEALKSLSFGGTIVAVGMAGQQQVNLDLLLFAMKGAKLLAASPSYLAPELLETAMDEVLKLVAQYELQPLISRVFPFEEAIEALRYMDESRPFGKVILSFG